MAKTTPTVTVTVEHLSDDDLAAAAAEASRRQRARAAEVRAQLPQMSDDELAALIERTEDEHGNCEDSLEWGHRVDPDAVCVACASRYHLAVRESEAAAKEPGADPNRYIPGVQTVSYRSRAVTDLKPGDTATHRPFPGTDRIEHVTVVSAHSPDDVTCQVTWVRTNDPDASAFTVTYDADEWVDASRVNPVHPRTA